MTENKREKREREVLHLLVQIAAMAGVRPGQNQEQEASSRSV